MKHFCLVELQARWFESDLIFAWCCVPLNTAIVADRSKIIFQIIQVAWNQFWCLSCPGSLCFNMMVRVFFSSLVCRWNWRRGKCVGLLNCICRDSCDPLNAHLKVCICGCDVTGWCHWEPVAVDRPLSGGKVFRDGGRQGEGLLERGWDGSLGCCGFLSLLPLPLKALRGLVESVPATKMLQFQVDPLGLPEPNMR